MSILWASYCVLHNPHPFEDRNAETYKDSGFATEGSIWLSQDMLLFRQFRSPSVIHSYNQHWNVSRHVRFTQSISADAFQSRSYGNCFLLNGFSTRLRRLLCIAHCVCGVLILRANRPNVIPFSNLKLKLAWSGGA